MLFQEVGSPILFSHPRIDSHPRLCPPEQASGPEAPKFYWQDFPCVLKDWEGKKKLALCIREMGQKELLFAW